MNCYCLLLPPCSWWSVKRLKLSFCLCLRLWSTSVTWTALWFVSSYGEPSGTFASLTTSSGQLLSHFLISQKQNLHSSCQNSSVKQILTTSGFRLVLHFVSQQHLVKNTQLSVTSSGESGVKSLCCFCFCWCLRDDTGQYITNSRNCYKKCKYTKEAQETDYNLNFLSERSSGMWLCVNESSGFSLDMNLCLSGALIRVAPQVMH